MEKMSSEGNVIPVSGLMKKIFADIICLLLVAVPILIFYCVGKPYERGFFCDDESLKHPYHESTVPSWALYVFGVGLPVIIIICTEFMVFKKSESSKVILRRRVPFWMWECYRHIGVFGFGACCSQLTTDVAKYTIGRLRPHFYSVCQPDVDCSSPVNKYKYIERFTCKGANEYLLKDMRLSFPSGHSSFSTYCMLFLVAYLQAKFLWKGSKLLKHTLQYIALMLAAYTSLSRISDYKHHWSDVLAGVVQGAVVAILIVIFVTDFYPKQNTAKRADVLPVDSYVLESGINAGEGSQLKYSNNRVI